MADDDTTIAGAGDSPAGVQDGANATPDVTENATPDVALAPGQTPQTDVNPFAFSAEDGGNETDVPQKPEKRAEDGAADYAPDFGADFNESDEVRAQVSEYAREAGIDASAAGKFVSSLCSMFKKQEAAKAAADFEGLQKDWGGDFGRNMAATKKFLGGMLRRGEISEADARELMSPAVFRFAHAVQSRLGEGRVAGTGARDAVSRRAEMQDMLDNPANPYFKALANPRSPEYAAAAAYFNEVAGAKIY